MAAKHPSNGQPEILVRGNQSLIGVVEVEDGQEVTHYFTEDDTVTSDEDIQAALALVGAWSDLNWDEMEAELDRIRHESQPTAPIEW